MTVGRKPVLVTGASKGIGLAVVFGMFVAGITRVIMPGRRHRA